MAAGRSPLRWLAGLLTLILLVLAGCSGARRPVYGTTALPPAVPPPARDTLAADPPSVTASLYSHATPGFLTTPAEPLAPPSSVGSLLRAADSHFQAGTRLFRAGALETARQEFDAAIDVLLSGGADGPGSADIERKLAELVDAIHEYDISGLGAAEPDSPQVFDRATIEQIPEPTFPIDPKLRNQVAEELKVTVSQLPLELNDEVLRYINYFSSTRGRQTLKYGLERMGRYQALIRRILDEEGVPQELIHLAQAESAFMPRAVSYKSATGMWQFIQSRGQEYGLMRTKATDDRLDPEKATRAAARHLRDLYNEFGDWYLAMAAYNCGPVTIERAVERTGYADFWELRRRNLLPKESANYLPIILAMVITAKNPGHYGLEGIDFDPPIKYSTIETEAPTRLELIADITEQPIARIRELNPALLTNLAPAGYSLHVPEGADAAVLSALELIPSENRAAWRLHRVAEGDTLTGVAVRYRTTTQQLLAANPAAASVWDPGSLLIVPAAAPVEPRAAAPRKAAVRKTTTAKKTATVKPAASQRSKTAAPAKSPTPALVASKQTATAKRGTSVR
jgi:membrane-bound lytic murein transglycosylase D